jgi:predicted nucleic acid-binding protein
LTLVLDTSVLAAFLHEGDPDHGNAAAIMRRVLAGKHGAPVSCDHVLDEGLTLLRQRPGHEAVSRRFAAMFHGDRGLKAFVRLHALDAEATRRAVALHFERYDRGFSFADCALVVLARDLDAPVASFGAHFDGIVERVKE